MKNLFRKLASIVTTFAISVSIVSLPEGLSAAQLTFFTDRNAWEFTVQNFQTEDFEGAPLGILSANTIHDLGVLQFFYEGPPVAIEFPRIRDIGEVNGTRELEGETEMGGGTTTPGPNLFIYPTEIRAWGADFKWVNPTTSVLFAGNSVILSDYLDNINGGEQFEGFIGIIADTNFSEITIETSCGISCNDVYNIDDISFSSSIVPIPPAVWLFGSGLLGLVGISRRKKA